MSRPKKCRRICSLPKLRRFGPAGDHAIDESSAIQMTMDEYEAIRLVDLLGCTQGECAAQMGVARTTVQAMVDAAHRKLALALACGQQLWITGGNVVLCEQAQACPGKDCRSHCASRCCGCKGCLEAVKPHCSSPL